MEQQARNMNLEALANDITDVTDPSSITKVLAYYEEIEQEAEDYLQLLHKILQNEEITWEQPWYQQGECSITKPHSPYYTLNETAEEKFRTDKISSEEHEKINKNWRKFLKKYNIPDKLRMFAAWKNRNKGSQTRNHSLERIRRFVAAHLAKGLQRTVYQVFIYVQHYNLSLETSTKSIYNDNEQKIIEVCFLHIMDKAPAVLSIVLGRHVRGLYKRRAAVKSGNKIEKKRERWCMERAEKFLNGMLKYSNLPLDKLKNRTFDKSFWLQLQEEMDCDYAYLNFFWYAYLHVQLFVKCDIKLNKLRRKLFKVLRDSPYKVWSDIKWNELLKYFPDGVTIRFLHKMIIAIVRKYPNYLKTSLSEVANFGLERIQTKRYTNKRLKRLMLNDEGGLEVIHHELEA